MSAPSLSPRDRRTLLAGAAVIGAILLVFRGVPAWRRWDEGTRASAQELVDAAARARVEARALPAAADSVEARQRRLVGLAARLLDGRTPAAAGASLASLISGAAARANVTLGSVQVEPDTATGSTFVRVAVRGDATGDLPGLTRMLAQLEGGPELLDVRQISITQPDAGGPADRPEQLRLTFVVEGLAFPRAAAASTDSVDEDSGDGEATAAADSTRRRTR